MRTRQDNYVNNQGEYLNETKGKSEQYTHNDLQVQKRNVEKVKNLGRRKEKEKNRGQLLIKEKQVVRFPWVLQDGGNVYGEQNVYTDF